MIDRDIAPRLTPLAAPVLMQHSIEHLPNGVELIITNDPNQEVYKLDILFKSGVVYQKKPLLATTTINMLGEGTSKHTSEQISELFDYYGSYIEANVSMVNAELSIIGMCKYAEPIINLTSELLTDSIFPEKELNLFLKNKRQEYLVQCERTSYIARKEFMSKMYGPQHPYANCITVDDYNNVTKQDVEEFYKARFNAENCKVFVAGNITKEMLAIIRKAFSAIPMAEKITEPFIPLISPAPIGTYHITKPDAVQNSIRIGKSGVSLTDPNYPEFLLLNTLFGGYFSSRLMSNIREDKGYTYGIQSCNLTLPTTASWFIAADVKSSATEICVQECLNEMQKIINTPIDDDEFNRARQYINGEILREIDGVFAQSDMLKHKMSFGMDLNIYNAIVKRIASCTPERLQELASIYLKPSDCYIITVGI